MANPCLTGVPILWSDVWDAVIMIPLFTRATLYHVAGMCVYLPTQTVHGHCDPTTDTLPFHPWGSLVLREKLHCSCLKTFLKMLPHLLLIITYSMGIFTQTQRCAISDCK